MLGHEDIKNTSVPFLFFANKADAPGALSPVECMQLLEQATKAHWYAQLKQHMGWNNTHVLQYVKMKSLNAQPADSMVVGVSPVGA